jgi:outer membrane protein OmpA-like peptidoglycan-associated protein
MSLARVNVTLPVVLLAAIVGAPAPTTAAQMPSSVRVVSPTAPIMRWFPYVERSRDVLMTVESGAELDVLDRQGDYYWVIAPPDAFGTRRPGWVAVRDVEMPTERASSLASDPGRRDAASTVSAPSRTDTAPTDTVGTDAARTDTDRTDSVRTDAVQVDAVQTETIKVPEAVIVASDSGTSETAAQNARKGSVFGDVHFDLNDYDLRSDETKILDAAADALKEDPSLSFTIEGYACDIGTPAYNLDLGLRRANVVKNYLVRKGVSAGRLRAMSFGEARAKYDNAREETRRLNRRVSLVPTVQP